MKGDLGLGEKTDEGAEDGMDEGGEDGDDGEQLEEPYHRLLWEKAWV